jgi:hypothetical protein
MIDYILHSLFIFTEKRSVLNGNLNVVKKADYAEVTYILPKYEESFLAKLRQNSSLPAVFMETIQ